MIKSLMFKEFRLSVSPLLWLVVVFPFLLLIPSWIFFFALAYVYLAFMVICQTDRANQDLFFVRSLPVPKSGIVLARTCTVVIFQVVQLVLGAVCAVIRHAIYSGNNAAGMNPNLAFFGLVMVMYAVFNLIFLPGYYKRAYRMLWPILGGAIISVVVGAVLTSVPMAIPVLNDRGLGHFGYQIVVFLIGVVVYAGLTWLAYRKAASNFEKVDL